MEFKLHAPFKPTGDQPQAIEKLARGVELGLDEQVLLGVTGSGKTFTMASVIEKVQRPTLVLAHNKTLAAQLCAEFKEFFPENAVEYFVSYYDYYQPEAYIPHTDTYIAKDASTNEEIDRLRLSATCALLERRDVIVVSSVSCIYGLGEPEDFEKLMISLRPGMTMERDFLLKRLIEIRYERNDVAFERNRFRVRGDTVELYPAYYRDKAIRVEFFGDEIDRISEFTPVNGQVTRTLQHIAIYPASHYVTTKDKLERAIVEIDRELDEREHFVDLLLDLVARQLLLAQRERHVFKHVQVGEESVALKDGVDVALVRRDVVDALAEEENVALIRRFEAADHAQGRSLAAAGRAEQRQKFVVVNVEVDAVENGLAIKLLGDVPELNDFFHGCVSPLCTKNAAASAAALVSKHMPLGAQQPSAAHAHRSQQNVVS